MGIWALCWACSRFGGASPCWTTRFWGRALGIVFLDRLLLMWVCAMEVSKYRRDLELIKQRYYERGRNAAFLSEAETHIPSYEKQGSVVFGGRYADAAEDRR